MNFLKVLNYVINQIIKASFCNFHKIYFNLWVVKPVVVWNYIAYPPEETLKIAKLCLIIQNGTKFCLEYPKKSLVVNEFRIFKTIRL